MSRAVSTVYIYYTVMYGQCNFKPVKQQLARGEGCEKGGGGEWGEGGEKAGGGGGGKINDFELLCFKCL